MERQRSRALGICTVLIESRVQLNYCWLRKVFTDHFRESLGDKETFSGVPSIPIRAFISEGNALYLTRLVARVIQGASYPNLSWRTFTTSEGIQKHSIHVWSIVKLKRVRQYRRKHNPGSKAYPYTPNWVPDPPSSFWRLVQREFQIVFLLTWKGNEYVLDLIDGIPENRFSGQSNTDSVQLGEGRKKGEIFLPVQTVYNYWISCSLDSSFNYEIIPLQYWE